MIRQSAWAFIILMLAVAASPATASAVPAGAPMMPMPSMPGMPAGQADNKPCPCNCGMPMQAAAAAAAAPGPRSAGGQGPPGCSGAAIPLPGGANNPSGRVGGIRRIYPKNVLDHPDRAAVYTAIVARPGIDAGSIATELGMNRETLRYHLDKLETATRIVVMRDHGIVRYYENHGRYTLIERKVLQHLWNPTGKAILSLIAARPGITQAEISGSIVITVPTARWYLKRFRDDGITQEQRDGKFTRYTLIPAARGYFRSPVPYPAPAAVPG